MMLLLFRRATIIGKLRYYFLDRYYNRMVAFLLVALCLLLTLASTVLLRDSVLNAGVIKGFLPVLALVGLVAVVFMYRHLELCVVLILVVSTVLGDGISTGTGTKVTFTFVALWGCVFLWLFKQVVVERALKILPSPANRPAWLFMVAVIISLIWSSLFVEQTVFYVFSDKIFVRMMTTLVMLISVLAYFLFANVIQSERSIRFFVWWFIGVGLVFAVLRLGLGRVPEPLNARGQFPTWVGLIAVAFILFHKDLRWYIRLGLGVIALAWFYITLALGLSWYSGWMPLTLGCGVLLFVYSRPLFLVALVAGGIFLYLNQSGAQEELSAQSAESGETRSEAWNINMELNEKHLLFGTGPAGYALYYTTYLTGFYQLNHNNYFDILSQTGIVGFAFFMWFWLAMIVMAWRVFWAVPRGGFWFVIGVVVLAANLSTLLTMMLGDWITPFPYTQSLAGIDYTIWAWMIAGLTGALYHQFYVPTLKSAASTAAAWPSLSAGRPAALPETVAVVTVQQP
jgi:hypothetical protein